jgi:hypothetical protein
MIKATPTLIKTNKTKKKPMISYSYSAPSL